MTDQQLIEALLTGEEEALREYYFNYKGKVLRFIQSRVNTTEDAEEILQDTFVASLEALRDFTGSSALYTFLCGIAKHKIIDFYRKRKLKSIVFSQMSENIRPLISTLLRPEDEFDLIEIKTQIKKVLSLLKPIYSKVLTLKYLEGFSVTEIAQELLLSVKSIESLLVRARKAFAKEYSLRYSYSS